MNAFSAFAAALCAACVLIGALHLITPDGAMSKPVKYALSVVFLISVISAAAIPLKKISVDITVPDCEEYSEESLYATSAEYVYGRLLKNAGIEFTKITVCTDKSDDGSIIISKSKKNVFTNMSFVSFFHRFPMVPPPDMANSTLCRRR